MGKVAFRQHQWRQSVRLCLRRQPALIASALLFVPAFALPLAGCNGGSSSDTPTDRAGDKKADVRGKITHLSAATNGIGGTLLIEGVTEHDTNVDKASVRIQPDTTALYRRTGNGALQPLSFGDLRVGQSVEARFSGPVAESYPVQANAAEVIVLADE